MDIAHNIGSARRFLQKAPLSTIVSTILIVALFTATTIGLWRAKRGVNALNAQVEQQERKVNDLQARSKGQVAKLVAALEKRSRMLEESARKLRELQEITQLLEQCERNFEELHRLCRAKPKRAVPAGDTTWPHAHEGVTPGGKRS